MEPRTVNGLRRLLAFHDRHDLVRLLSRARLELDVSDDYGSLISSLLTTVEVFSPIEDCDSLRRLSNADTQFILDLLLELHPPRPHEVEIIDLQFLVDPLAPVASISTDDELLQDLQKQRDLMISVATGGPRINDVNAEYQSRHDRVNAALERRGFSNPNPYDNLWDWYAGWKSADLLTYDSRRAYVHAMYSHILDRVRGLSQVTALRLFEDATGWEKVDRGIKELRRRLSEAHTEEQYQAVGLLGRETLISLAQTVFDARRHAPVDGVTPSNTDAKRMLDAYFASELPGSSNEVARRHARAAVDLANDLQHRRTAEFRMAAFSAEATMSVANLVAIIAGRRDASSSGMREAG